MHMVPKFHLCWKWKKEKLQNMVTDACTKWRACLCGATEQYTNNALLYLCSMAMTAVKEQRDSAMP